MMAADETEQGRSTVKKLLAVLLALVMVLMSVSFSTSFAEEWVCPDCGKTNTTNFCTSCGAKHDVWICPNCGTENSDAFCGNCGTARPAEAQPETPASIEPAVEGTAADKAGDIITFGRYPQTADGTDQTPIEWIVLEVKDGKALVISRYGLDAVPYNTELVDVTWEKCTLRAWLNGDFLNAAFTPEEQTTILMTEVDNSTAQGYGKWDTDGGNNTQDQVFLLSYEEANRYFGVTFENISNTKSRVQVTDYAISRGAYTSSNNKTESGAKAGCWWLRSPGDSQILAACVNDDGSLCFVYVPYPNGCVRPALWINLESEIFKSENPQDGAAPQTEAEPAGVQAGDIVTFGRYPQTAEGTGQTPIEWIVMEVKDGKALVISKYGLDQVPYNSVDADVTWEACSLRAWLNSDFLNAAFSDEEQTAIPVTDVDNSATQGYSDWKTNGGNDTQDQIFLLSYADANRYFGVTYSDSNNIRARVQPTSYAIRQGAYTSFNNRTVNAATSGYWWLRSPGFSQHIAALVSDFGSLGFSFVDYKLACVRPALWIDLDSEIFRSENPQY